jgi:hypothetical protein
MRTDVVAKSKDAGAGDQVMVKIESFWIRMVERVGALGLLLFVLFYVFTSLIPQAQAQFKQSLDDQRTAFTDALKTERESFQKSLETQREDFLHALERTRSK